MKKGSLGYLLVEVRYPKQMIACNNRVVQDASTLNGFYISKSYLDYIKVHTRALVRLALCCSSYLGN